MACKSYPLTLTQEQLFTVASCLYEALPEDRQTVGHELLRDLFDTVLPAGWTPDWRIPSCHSVSGSPSPLFTADRVCLDNA